MMLIHDKGLWDDGKALVDFTGEFLVSVREAFLQLFLTQSVVEDTYGQTFRIFLTRRLFLTCM